MLRRVKSECFRGLEKIAEIKRGGPTYCFFFGGVILFSHLFVVDMLKKSQKSRVLLVMLTDSISGVYCF